MNNLSLDSHLVFIKDQIEWCDGCVIDRDENDDSICVRNYCNLDTTKYWLDMFIELEKDLGCPLEVVFKALKEGIIIKDLPKGYEHRKVILNYLVNDNSFIFRPSAPYGSCKLYLKDYKKTWWLSETKEE